MAFDRCVAICYPLRYTVILSRGLCTQLSAGTWACGFFFSLIHTFFTMRLPYCGPNMVSHYFCEGPSVRNLACMDTHVIEMVDLVISVFMVVAPLLLIVASSSVLCRPFSSSSPCRPAARLSPPVPPHPAVITFFYAPATYLYMRPNSSYSPEQDKQVSLFIMSSLLCLILWSTV